MAAYTEDSNNSISSARTRHAGSSSPSLGGHRVAGAPSADSVPAASTALPGSTPLFCPAAPPCTSQGGPSLGLIRGPNHFTNHISPSLSTHPKTQEGARPPNLQHRGSLPGGSWATRDSTRSRECQLYHSDHCVDLTTCALRRSRDQPGWTTISALLVPGRRCFELDGVNHEETALLSLSGTSHILHLRLVRAVPCAIPAAVRSCCIVW